MWSFIQMLRNDTFLRVGMWVVMSLLLAAVNFTIILELSSFIVRTIQIESIPLRRTIVLGAQFLTQLLPSIILYRLGSIKSLLRHVVLALVAWLLLSDGSLFVYALIIIQISLWAEVVSMYWRQNIQ